MLTLHSDFQTISGTQKAIASGKATVRNVVEKHLEAIERLNPQINAVTIANEDATDVADKLDRSPQNGRGPLFGVTVLIKDQIETRGLATAFGSIACKDYIPCHDATLVRKLKEAGAIILGKTTMPDWAASWFSTSSLSETTQNPYDLRRDPGGSSSGSAAAIAAGMAVVAIGGDTGGSIRLPSSFCGLVGVRVTPGRISRSGMSALVTPQDTPGPMTRTVEDAAKILDVLVGFDEADPYTSVSAIAPLAKSLTPFEDAVANPSLHGKRIGILRETFGTDPGILSVMESTLASLSKSGAKLIEICIPDLEHYKTFTSFYIPRAKSDINKFLASRPALSHLKIEELHAAGTYHQALGWTDVFIKGTSDMEYNPHYSKGMLQQADFQRVVASLFAQERLDAVIYPTCQLLAPKTQDILSGHWLTLDYPTNTVIASQLLFPAISVPVGKAKDHEDADSPELPVGLEILGLPLREESLMAVAAGVEKACIKD